MSEILALEEVIDTAVFGSKAVGLGEALRDGLPVPPGIALSGPIVERVAAGEDDAITEVVEAARPLGAPLAVRSSSRRSSTRTAPG
jgi:pyruvate,water dikinase